MKYSITRRLAPAVLALGIAASGVGLTAGNAFASSSHSTAAKLGASCSKSDKGKTAKVGKTELVCKDVKGKYKWEKK